MSESVTWTRSTTLALSTPAVYEALEALPSPGATPELERQFNVAKETAKAIIEANAVGEGEGVAFIVDIYGTANPDNKPVDGEPTDSLMVTVRQVPPVLSEEDETPEEMEAEAPV